jgi:hypothetical protein
MLATNVMNSRRLMLVNQRRGRFTLKAIRGSMAAVSAHPTAAPLAPARQATGYPLGAEFRFRNADFHSISAASTSAAETLGGHLTGRLTPLFPTLCRIAPRGYKLIDAIETGTNGLKLWLPGPFSTGAGRRVNRQFCAGEFDEFQCRHVDDAQPHSRHRR